MTEHLTDDTDLALSLREAAETIQPASGIEAIRSRTSGRATVRRIRPWAYGLAGAAVAASAITAIVLPRAEQERTPVAVPTSEVTVYYLADTDTGWGTLLFREHRTLAGDPLDAAVNAAVGSTVDGEALAASDPDYSAPWPAGTTATAQVEGAGIVVSIDDSGLADSQVDVDPAVAAAAVEALVRTAQAAHGTDQPVRLLLDGEEVDSILGVDTARALTPEPGFGHLSPMILDVPSEGQVVADGSLEFSGEASVPEATVVWRIAPSAGGRPVLNGFTTADGWDFESLTPYDDVIDVSALAPGEYVLTVSGQRMSGEGNPPHRDTRTFVVE